MSDYYQYWKVKETLPNPLYDGRAGAGLKTRKELKEGTVLRVEVIWRDVSPEEFDSLPPEVQATCRRARIPAAHTVRVLKDCGGPALVCPITPIEGHRYRQGVVRPLAEWAEPHEPTPVEWYTGEHGRPDYYLKLILEKGLVTVDQIRELGKESAESKRK